MNAYLDTSALLRILLGQPAQLKGWARYGTRVGSSLVEVECLRTLDRMRLMGEFGEDQAAGYRAGLYRLLQTVELVEPSPAILRRASSAFPTTVGTLDALHLATALAWRDEREATLIVATHDKAFGRAAMALGFKVEGL